MKTLVLFGSPRKDGNTRRLTEAFTDVLKEEQKEVRVLYLNDLNVRPCQGCLSCAEKGICRMTDDMRDIRKYFMESDLIVYATPVYWSAPSGQLKVVIDRCIAFFDGEYNSRVKGKKAVTLMTCADGDTATCQPAIDMFTKTFEGLGIDYLGNVVAAGCTGRGQVSGESLKEAGSLAKSLRP